MHLKCDFPVGNSECPNKAYREVYPIKYHKKPKLVQNYIIVHREPNPYFRRSGKSKEEFVFLKGYSFLCRKHFDKEWKRLGRKRMMYCTLSKMNESRMMLPLKPRKRVD